jgi:hypothetical protein
MMYANKISTVTPHEMIQQSIIVYAKILASMHSNMAAMVGGQPASVRTTGSSGAFSIPPTPNGAPFMAHCPMAMMSGLTGMNAYSWTKVVCANDVMVPVSNQISASLGTSTMVSVGA